MKRFYPTIKISRPLQGEHLTKARGLEDFMNAQQIGEGIGQ